MIRTALPPALDSHTLLVAAVIVHDQPAGQVLLLKRAAGSKFAPLHWDLPSGKAAKGESVTAAAARELKEETCILVVRNSNTLKRSDRHGEVLFINFQA